MKHKTWFRLVIKAIGVLLIGLSIPQVIMSFVEISYMYQFAAYEMSWRDWSWALGNGLQLLAGLYLLFGGKWIVNKVIPSNRAYCHECGYELSQVSGGNCPECGVHIDHANRATDCEPEQAVRR